MKPQVAYSSAVDPLPQTQPGRKGVEMQMAQTANDSQTKHSRGAEPTQSLPILTNLIYLATFLVRLWRNGAY